MQTRIDCMRQLAEVTPMTALAILAGASLIAFWLHASVPRAALVPWYMSMLALGALRFSFACLIRRRLDAHNIAAWEKRFIGISIVSGMAWGLLAWLPPATSSAETMTAITLSLFCVLLVSSSTLVANSHALGGFSLALIVPLLARVLTLDAHLAALYGTGMIVLGGVMFSAYCSHRRSLIAAMRAHYEASALLQQQQVIFESAGEGIVFLRPNPEYVVSCNHRFAELFGYPHTAMRGMPPWRWHPSREQWKELVAASLPEIVAGSCYRQELRLQRADGAQFWGEITGMAVDAKDLSAGTVWIVCDISATRAAEDALRINEERFRDLVKLSSDLYWEQDANFRFTHFDGPDEFTRKLPIQRVLGRTRWDVSDIIGVHELIWAHHIEKLKRHEPFRDFKYQIKGSDGCRYWLSVSGNPLFDADGTFVGYHGTASDITLRIESEERFRHLAYHDTLTRLPNRRLLADRLDQAVRNAGRNNHRVALLLIDLDGFKKVNDRHGHAAGDRVLEAVAARLRDIVRDMDTVARMGGDEFVVLLPEIDSAEDAVIVADKIHVAINDPIADGSYLHSVGSSIGISIFPDHGDDVEALLHRADHAMYHGKSAGGKTTRMFDTSLLN